MILPVWKGRSRVSFSSEIKEWVTAIKEFWQEENRKHPYRHLIIAALFFIYFMLHYFSGRFR